MYLWHSINCMLKDTISLGNNKAPACESRGFVHKKRRCAFWHTSYNLNCDPAGTRTQDPNIKSVVLYRLSYWILQLCFPIAVAKIVILFEFPKDKRIFYKKRQDKKNTLAPMDALFIVIYPECPVKTFDIFLLNSEHPLFVCLWLSCGQCSFLKLVY